MHAKGFVVALLLCLTAVPASAQGPVFARDPAAFLPVVDANGARVSLPPATSPDTLLFKAANREPLLAPDGHQIKLGEWLGFSGTARVKCVRKRTQVNINLQNLIPHGLYTVWVFGRHNQSDPRPYLGAVTSTIGSQKAFTANKKGNLSVSDVIVPGPLSTMGAIDGCLLNDFFYAFTIVYHSRGETYGAVPGPPDSSLNQVFFDIFE